MACTDGIPASPRESARSATSGGSVTESEETATDVAQPASAEPAVRRACAPFAPAFRPGCEAYHSENYEAAATALLDAVNAAPEHEDSGLLLSMIAHAFQRLERHESCARIFQRLIDELGPQRSQDRARDELLTAILGEAHFYLGLRAAAGERYEESLYLFCVLADSPRFGRSTSEQVQTYRRDARANVAQLLERLERYPEALRYARRIVDESTLRDEIWREAGERILRLSVSPRSSMP